MINNHDIRLARGGSYPRFQLLFMLHKYILQKALVSFSIFAALKNTVTMNLSALKISCFSFLCLLLVSCASEQERAEKAIAAKEKELIGDSTMALDFSKARDMLKLYADYIKKYPDAPLSENYLFKAAEISMGMMQSNVAIKYFGQFYEKYPQSEKAPYSLFMQGFVYETQLKDLEKAKWYYEKFISEFPEHQLVSDARFSIEHLGKSEEELIREFEAMLKRDSAAEAKAE